MTGIGNCTVISFDPEIAVVESNGMVIVGDGVVVAIGGPELRSAYPEMEFVDAQGGLVMPGLICSHTHFYGAFARGWAVPGVPAGSFNEVLERLWWRLDRALSLEDVEASAEVCLAEAVRHGTTLLVDHHSSPTAIDGSLDAIAGAVKRSGLRACLCYEVSDRDGPEAALAAVRENQRFAQSLRRDEAAASGRLSACFGLHASFTLSPRTLERSVEAAGPLGIGFHVHLGEAQSDQSDSMDRYGLRVASRFERAGILGPSTIAAHCVHVDAPEIATLAATNTAVVHNPRSNMNNAVGVAPVAGMRSAGVTVGLGNDGFSMDMLEEIKVACLVHKLAAADPRAMPVDQAVALAFNANARIAGQAFAPLFAGADRLGRLSPGGPADLVVLEYRPTTPLTQANLAGHIVFGMDATNVVHTMVAGRWLMRDRRLLTIDEEAVTAHSRELAARLWRRLD